jgi:hypothetical protein
VTGAGAAPRTRRRGSRTATALDYLSCAATLGHVVSGFAAPIAGQLGAAGSLLPDAAAAVDEQGRRRQLEGGREQTRAHARLAFHSDREGKTARLTRGSVAMGIAGSALAESKSSRPAWPSRCLMPRQTTARLSIRSGAYLARTAARKRSPH